MMTHRGTTAMLMLVSVTLVVVSASFLMSRQVERASSAEQPAKREEQQAQAARFERICGDFGMAVGSVDVKLWGDGSARSFFVRCLAVEESLQ